MTNRRDMIDEALLRPGRLEVQIEIGLPDEHGRLQILNIHTARLREHGKLNADVDLKEFSELTRNFSGAEIEGLVRAAMAFAMNRHIKVTISLPSSSKNDLFLSGREKRGNRSPSGGEITDLPSGFYSRIRERH